MKSIFLYTGTGAYQAKDVESFLSCFDLDYIRICEHILRKIAEKGVFIVPGGQIRAYIPSWGAEGIKTIRDRVKKGSVYIGICAGSYVAGNSFGGENGLGFVTNDFPYRKFQKNIDVMDEKGNLFQMIAENGPDLSKLSGGRVLWRSSNGEPQLVEIMYGKGKVYLFSSHPEGSNYYKKYPKTFSGAKAFIRFLEKL